MENITSQSTSVKRIILIAMSALLLAEVAETTSFSLYIIGLVFSSIIVFSNTLGKNRIFEFVMVMYMCALFPVQLARGGLFPIVSFICLILALLTKVRLSEIKNKDSLFYWFIFLLAFSSVLGWLFINSSDLINKVLAIASFTGTLFLFILSGQIILTQARIIQFVKLNMFLACYALVASLNTMFKVIPKFVFMPQWIPDDINVSDGFAAGAGGIVGVSPLNGQHNLMKMLSDTHLRKMLTSNAKKTYNMEFSSATIANEFIDNIHHIYDNYYNDKKIPQENKFDKSDFSL